MLSNRTELEEIAMLQILFGTAFVERSYYNPKRDFTETTQLFYIYVQPVFTFFLILWFMSLVYGLWTKDFVKIYGFMTLYSCTDISLIIIHGVIFMYSFTLEENYMRYTMCYLHKYTSTFLSRVFITFSQWVRVAQIFQRFIIAYKPMTYNQYFNKKIVVCFFVILLSITTGLAIVPAFLLDFEKVVTIDKQTKELIEIGREHGVFSKSHVFITETHLYRMYSYAVFVLQSLLPLIFILGLLIALNQVLKTQAAFRARFYVISTLRQSSEDRLMKVNIIVGISTVILTMFMGFGTILDVVIQEIPEDAKLWIEVFGYIHLVLYIINIPINLFIFSLLSKKFRKTLKKLYPCNV